MSKSKKIVAIGAHPDDYEIGAAMRLAYHAIRGDDVMGIICTDGEMGGEKEMRLNEAQNAADLIGMKKLYTLHHPDTHLYEDLVWLKDDIEKIISREEPSVVYIIHPKDRHQDHRTANEAAMIACRDVPNIMFYKTPSTIFTEFQPHVFHIGSREEYLKKEEIVKRHKSQVDTGRINLDQMETEAKHFCFYAGNPDKPNSGYAEAFSANHIILNLMEEE